MGSIRKVCERIGPKRTTWGYGPLGFDRIGDTAWKALWQSGLRSSARQIVSANVRDTKADTVVCLPFGNRIGFFVSGYAAVWLITLMAAFLPFGVST